MKGLFTGAKLIGSLGLLVTGLCSCANTEVQNTESLLSAAGFHTETPSTQAPLATYNRTAPYKLERNTISGSTLYTCADKRKGVVYIGGDEAYQRYRQLAVQQSTAEKEPEAWYGSYIEHANQVKSINL